MITFVRLVQGGFFRVTYLFKLPSLKLSYKSDKKYIFVLNCISAMVHHLGQNGLLWWPKVNYFVIFIIYKTIEYSWVGVGGYYYYSRSHLFSWSRCFCWVNILFSKRIKTLMIADRIVVHYWCVLMYSLSQLRDNYRALIFGNHDIPILKRLAPIIYNAYFVSIAVWVVFVFKSGAPGTPFHTLKT